MDLTHKDRTIISLLLQILEKLDPDGAEHLEKVRTAIECGYELHYNDLGNVYEETLSVDECQEVLDILSMFRCLKHSYEELEPSEQSTIKIRDISFFGFDGNNERQYGYAQYFIETLGRFQELSSVGLNSHMPSLGVYRRMLAEYETTSKHDLSVDEITRVSEARIHPEMREVKPTSSL